VEDATTLSWSSAAVSEWVCIVYIQCIIVINSLWAASFDEQICFSGRPSWCSL